MTGVTSKTNIRKMGSKLRFRRKKLSKFFSLQNSSIGIWSKVQKIA